MTPQQLKNFKERFIELNMFLLETGRITINQYREDLNRLNSL